MLSKAKITGLGACLPNEPVYNDYYESYLETSDEWIKIRTGIEARHLVTTQTLTDLAASAVSEALSNTKPAKGHGFNIF